MSAAAGLFVALGLFCLGWGIEGGLRAVAAAIRERGGK